MGSNGGGGPWWYAQGRERARNANEGVVVKGNRYPSVKLNARWDWRGGCRRFAPARACMQGTEDSCVSAQPGLGALFALVGPGLVTCVVYQTPSLLHGGCKPDASRVTKHALEE